MNTQSIGFRLILFYATLICGVFVLLALIMYFSMERYLEKNLADTLIWRCHLIADTLVSEIGQKGETYLAEEIVARFAPETNGRFVRVTQKGGRQIYASGVPKDQSFDPRFLSPLIGMPQNDFVRKETFGEGKSLLVAAVPYVAGNSGEFIVEVGSPIAPIESFLRQLRTIFLIVFPIVVAVSIGGGFFLIRKALGPVDKIARSAEEITFHNLSQRLPVAKTGDELERLSLSLNRMITRLDQSFQHTRRFSADASHELRTPLTIIRGELEPLVQNQALPQAARDSLGSILEEAEHLNKIVEGLLALARIDAGDTNQEWTTFDLARLAANTAEQMCLLAEDKRIAISCDASQPVKMKGDQGRLKQVIVNLLDNAIKFTPEGGAITMRVASKAEEALLEVADNGIGVPAEALPHVFDRFFRVDKARLRDLGGAGLGLSIVKSICTAHGGRVDMVSAVGRGSRVRVFFPSTNGTPERHS